MGRTTLNRYKRSFGIGLAESALGSKKAEAGKEGVYWSLLEKITERESRKGDPRKVDKRKKIWKDPLPKDATNFLENGV